MPAAADWARLCVIEYVWAMSSPSLPEHGLDVWRPPQGARARVVRVGALQGCPAHPGGAAPGIAGRRVGRAGGRVCVH